MNQIHESKNDCTYRRYDTLLEMVGMASKRNFEVLDKIDYQFKNRNHDMVRQRRKKSVADFTRGETITFRLEQEDSINEADINIENFDDEGKKKYSVLFAGPTPSFKVEAALNFTNTKLKQLKIYEQKSFKKTKYLLKAFLNCHAAQAKH